VERFQHLDEVEKAVADQETAISQAHTNIRGALLGQLRALTGADWHSPELVPRLRQLQGRLLQQEKKIKDTEHAVQLFVKALERMAEVYAEFLAADP